MTNPSPALLVLAGWLTLTLTLAVPSQADEPATVFVGTYTGKESRGIYRFAFNETTGEAGDVTLAAEMKNPAFLAIAPNGRFLYAVSEVDSADGQKGGAVSGFAIEPKTANLSPLNHASTVGAGPCYVGVDKAGKNALVANYGGGSVAVLPIEGNGRLAGKPGAFVQHTGSSVNPARQMEPHAHSINLDANNRFAFAADLGLDQILVYRFDPANGSLTPNDPPAAKLPLGSGPRHFDFHPSGVFAYAINELNSTVSAFQYDFERGALTDLQTISTLPEGTSAENNFPADIHVHPSGRFLYGSNRGFNSIVAYAIDKDSGRLTVVGQQTEGIKNPRNFAIDPTGKFLLVANQDANTVVVFRIDPDRGSLLPTGQTVKVPTPVCLKFWGTTPAK